MVNVKMWAKALRTIPRIDKNEWNNLDLISKWLIASRSAVFIMTVFSGIVGGLLAWSYNSFNWFPFILSVVGLTLAHAANNMINDYLDHKKGIDKDNYYRSLYGPQTIEHGFLSKKQLLSYILVTLLLAIGIGAILIYQTNITTLYLLLAGLFFVVFYTWPLKYIGLGEPVVLLVWGPLMIGGTFIVVSGLNWNWEVALIALTYAIGPTTVLFGKHIDKLKEDRLKKVYTLPVILKEASARYTAIGLWISQYALTSYLILTGSLGWAFLILLLALPKFIQTAKVFSKPRPDSEPESLEKGIWPLYLSANAFVYNKRFSMLFLLALIIDLVLNKSGIL